ncbi:MAG TPA: GH1 family beta-glucosidase [Candidatus Obscuribacterales bacterium]
MTQNSVLVFPRGFVWGLATAAYQIEGAVSEDGRGESVWDRFCRVPGNVVNGDTGDVACDHYHRLAEDLMLLKQLGMKAYRFSISWPRVLPKGRGAVNWAGLDFYDRVVDILLTLGIQPFVTLYHWDLPQALEDEGGWTKRDTAGYFADFAAVVAKRLGDRVSNWITLNEPYIVARYGYLTGEHPPGIKHKPTMYKVAHHLMVAHGLAMQAIRGVSPDANVGISLFMAPHEAIGDDEADRQAAERQWRLHCGWFLDPLLKAAYSSECLEDFADADTVINANDMALISQRNDLLGVNYYFRVPTLATGEVKRVAHSKYTDMDWEVCPDALTRLLVRLRNEYALPPIYITENGAAYKDSLDGDGAVHDPDRIEYLRDHLVAVWNAIKSQVSIKGYFAWSLLDNFEWALGYSKRFGLVYVDYDNQKRHIKDSGYWYSRVATRGELDLVLPRESMHPVF